MSDQEIRILELSIKAMSAAFDGFIGECMDAEGKPKAPTPQAIVKARACLPATCEHGFKKKKRVDD